MKFDSHQKSIDRVTFGLARRLLSSMLALVSLPVVAQELSLGPEASFRASVECGTEELQEMIEGLRSLNHSTRETAYFKLLRCGADALPAIEKAFPDADADLAERLVRIASDLAVHPHEGPGPAALRLLKRLEVSPWSIPRMLAQRSLQSLSDHQRTVVEEDLRNLGAPCTYGEHQVMTDLRQPLPYIRFDATFRGNAKDLDRLQWLQGIEMLILDGPQVTGEWLAHIDSMPDLRILQIREASITKEDLAVLENIENLETLEILYTPIDDSALPNLARIPVETNMRLFGTKVSEEGFKQLQESLSDIDIIYGRGGYLGVKITPMRDQVVISETIPGLAADQAGLRARDQITAINSKEVKKFEDLRAELANYFAGEEVQVHFLREDPATGELKSNTVSVKLSQQQ